MKRLKLNEGKGKELADLLRKEFCIPDGAKWFEIRIAINEPITVKCEYIAEDKELG